MGAVTLERRRTERRALDTNGLAAASWPQWSSTARLVIDEPDRLEEAVEIADEVLGEIDSACSRFRYDSELSRLAARLPEGAEVSRTLAQLVARALEAAAATDGAVDPTVATALVGGSDRELRLVLDDGRPVRAVTSQRQGWRSVRLIGRHLTVPAHLRLDLGATAPALAADAVAERVHTELGAAVLCELGGDIAVAGGGPGADPEGGWPVLVLDAPGDPAARIRLHGGGLATSSAQHRGRAGLGEARNHILDPRTGLPAAPVWRTVTVTAPSCYAANTLSTAAIVLGAAAPEWLASRAAARLVSGDGEVVTVGGWPA